MGCESSKNYQKQQEHKSKNNKSIDDRETIDEYEKGKIKFLDRKQTLGLIGLENIGATCYMNSTLQCLSNTDKLTTYFLEKFTYKKDDVSKKISNNFYIVLHNLWESEKNYYKPIKFKKALSEENPLFSGINANDSKDLLNFLLERLHVELNKASNDNITKINNIQNLNQLSEEQAKQSFLNAFIKNHKSIISDLFYFTIETISICGGCGCKRYNFQVGFFLEFPLEQVNYYLFQNARIKSLINQDGSNPDVNLYDCFDYYKKLDKMTGQNQMYCNCCHNLCDSIYGTSLYILPEILIINLNRGKNAVYQCKVNFPEELHLRKYVTIKKINTKYQLYAVICHIGPSSMSGHFVAYCRNRIDDNWYLFNDAIVTKCENKKEYLTKMPYILFYKSINNKKIANNNPKNINQNCNNFINNQNNCNNFNNFGNNNNNFNMNNNNLINFDMNNFNMNNFDMNNFNMNNFNMNNFDMNNNINNFNKNNFNNNFDMNNNINNFNNMNNFNNNHMMNNNNNGLNNNNGFDNNNGFNNNNGLNNNNGFNNNNGLNNNFNQNFNFNDNNMMQNQNFFNN